jgi:hypothetical protein
MSRPRVRWEAAPRDVHAEAGEDVGHVHVVRADAARAVRVAVSVVVLALPLVGQDGIRLVDLLEARLGIGGVVHVRMQLASLLEERALDRPGIGITLDAQYLVVVLLHSNIPESVRCRSIANMPSTPETGHFTHACPS